MSEEPTMREIFGRAAPAADDDDKPRPAPRRAPADKPLDGTTNKTEVKRSFYLAANGITRAFGLPNVDVYERNVERLEFEESEFEEAAEAFVILLNQHAQLRIVMRLLAPIAGLGALFSVIDRMVRSFQLKRELAEQKRAADRAARSGESAMELDAEGNPVGPIREDNKRGSFWPLGKR